MSTSHDHREPLDTEERDLAARLARIGPLDGPSPALDAKILAAAHAAAATRRPNRRRHWAAAWLGVPPALITGVGVAAAAVLALGLVWQLRPSTSVLVARDEGAGSSDEEIFVVATPAQSAPARINNPPPFPNEPAPAAAAQAASKASAPMATTTPSNESPARANAAPAAAAEARMESAPVPQVVAEQAGAAAAQPNSDAAAADGFVAEPPAAAPSAGIARKHATYTTSARATAERERAPMPAAAPAAPSPASPAAEAESKTLDRIEVTGSRIRRDAPGARPLAEVAVDEDTHLPAAEWLERIRARRDEGRLDEARQSLRLFRRDYPRIRIPDDLLPLLDRRQ